MFTISIHFNLFVFGPKMKKRMQVSFSLFLSKSILAGGFISTKAPFPPKIYYTLCKVFSCYGSSSPFHFISHKIGLLICYFWRKKRKTIATHLCTTIKKTPKLCTTAHFYPILYVASHIFLAWTVVLSSLCLVMSRNVQCCVYYGISQFPSIL